MNIMSEQLEAYSLGISIDKLRQWKDGFYETYAVSRVKPIETVKVNPVKRIRADKN